MGCSSELLERQYRVAEEDKSRVLGFLYKTAPGRLCLKLVVNPRVSKVGGMILDSWVSSLFVAPFIWRHKIDMSDYEKKKYSSFNDFFTRKLKRGKRNIDLDSAHLISPCDGKLSVFEIGEEDRFHIKGASYKVCDLLRNHELADKYSGGLCLIFRLTPDDYHRYCYIDDGFKGDNTFIPGVLHTVRGISQEKYEIYKENCREYSFLNTEHFGTVIQIEVGALMIGRITNHHGRYSFKRGEEKGLFEFGGSTIVLLLKKETAQIDSDILRNCAAGEETTVKLGEKIGEAV